MYHSKKTIAGFTLIELLIAIAVTTLISSIVLAAFGEYRLRQSMSGSVESVLAALSKAHLDTISSRNDSPNGVSLKSDEVIYFKGSPYPGDSAATNIRYKLPSAIEISSISLNGGGSEVFFKQLSGTTNNYGTFVIRAKSKTSVSATITINQTGATSL